MRLWWQTSPERLQRRYEASRRAWRESHPLIPGSSWTPPPGHPREAEFLGQPADRPHE